MTRDSASQGANVIQRGNCMFSVLQIVLRCMAMLTAFGLVNISSLQDRTSGSLAGLESPLPPQLNPVAIRRVETTRPYVAITVDDFYTGNYSNAVAIRMLQAANDKGAQLTLCPAGSGLVEYEKKHPLQAAHIKMLVAAGNYELCDHTYSHPIMPKLGARGNIGAEVREIQRGEAEIRSFFGRGPSPIFRPPFGSWNVGTVQAAQTAGYPRVILWSIDTGDSEGPERPAWQLVNNVGCVQPGDIILMHANRKSSADALPVIIDLVRSRGLEPVSISKLLSSGKPVYSSNPSDMKRIYTCRR